MGISMTVSTLLLVCLMMPHFATAGNQIALDTVSIANNDNNDTLIVTVTYNADHPANVTWNIPSPDHFDTAQNLDFQQTDTFNEGHGQTIMAIAHEVAVSQHTGRWRRVLNLGNAHCQLDVILPPLVEFFSRTPATQNFQGLALTVEKDGQALDPGQNITLDTPRADLVLQMSSPELAKFDYIYGPWVSHTRIDDSKYGFPYNVTDYGSEEDSVFDDDSGSWTGSSTVKQFVLPVFQRPVHQGVLKIYFLFISAAQGADSLVTDVYFKQDYRL